jgi:hypothetical protein
MNILDSFNEMALAEHKIDIIWLIDLQRAQLHTSFQF